MTHLIQQIEAGMMKDNVPEFRPGDTVRVMVKVKEGERERLQAYEGVVIARRNRGYNSAFTVRKASQGEGIERVFHIHNPNVAEIIVVRKGHVRKAKLYYLRERSGRSARIRERLDLNKNKPAQEARSAAE